MSTQPPKSIDPFAAKPKIEMDQLPLAELTRRFLSLLSIEKSQVPIGSVPIFGVDRGSAFVQSYNIGNQTLGTSSQWAVLANSITANVAVSGLRDLHLMAGGSAISSGAGATHGVSFAIDGVEFTTMVFGRAANTGNGLHYVNGNANVLAWNMFGVVPASMLERKVYSIEITTRQSSGAASGILYADGTNSFNLYALEE
jgi:hypothetical protein